VAATTPPPADTSTPSPTTYPLWGLVLTLAAIAERVERCRDPGANADEAPTPPSDLDGPERSAA
jgi:hypothetical protein